MLRLAAATSLAALALALPSQAGAATRTVKLYTDVAASAPSNDSGPPGTLRHMVEKVAQPGDTINFDRPGVVQLNTALEIPRRLRGLTIDGAAPGGRAGIRFAATSTPSVKASRTWALNATAPNVTVKNLVFENATVGFAGATVVSRVGGARVLDCAFVGRGASIIGTLTVDLLVKGNTFEGDQGAALHLHLSDRPVVTRNVFTMRGGTAIVGDGVSGLLLEDNKLTGAGIQLQLARSRIVHNRIIGGPLGPALHLRGNGERQDATVQDNDITVNSAAGVRLIGAIGMTAKSNRFDASRDSAINLGCVTGQRPEMQLSRNRLTGIGIRVLCDLSATLTGNTIAEARGPALQAAAGRTTVNGGTMTGNGAGVLANGRARLKLDGVQITANRGAGIRAREDASVAVKRMAMGTNAGPGIVARGGGPSPRAPALTYDRKKARIKGRACALCRVELYASEPEPQLGNPRHGEGTHVIGTVQARPDGRFTFPRRGALRCPPSGRVTAVATRTGGASSVFARDIECACTVYKEFEVDPQMVPRFGFANFGISARFPAETTVNEVDLTDTATDLRPRDDAFAPALKWNEDRNPFARQPPGQYAEDFFATFQYADNNGPAPTQPKAVWAFTVSYTPPKSVKGCTATVT